MTESTTLKKEDTDKTDINNLSRSNLMKISEEVPAFMSEKIKGSMDISTNNLIDCLKYCGFQASNLYVAAEKFKQIINDPDYHITLGFSAVGTTSGLREIISNFLSVFPVNDVVMTGAGIEEDIMKTFSSNYTLKNLHLNERLLRDKGWNQSGNIIVPNENYIIFESFLKKLNWGNISNCKTFLEEVNQFNSDDSSIIKICQNKGIPIHSLCFWDGAIGDFAVTNSSLIKNFNEQEDYRDYVYRVTKAKKTFAIILGGGTVKHNVANAHIIRGGLDGVILFNTGIEEDGSNAGDPVKTLYTWGKLKDKGVKVYGCYTINFIFFLIILNKLNCKN